MVATKLGINKITKIAWQKWACKRALCLIRRSLVIITSWIRIRLTSLLNESVVLKFGPLICDKQRFKQHWECFAMAAIQEGKVIFFSIFFRISNFEHFLSLKFIWSPSCDLRYSTEVALIFFHSEYSRPGRKRSLFGGREEDWTKPGNFNTLVEFVFLVSPVDEIAVCRVFVFVVRVDGINAERRAFVGM